MEVHHHPKVEKKRFKEYFLEFLMIFLAVTMGFIAENIREHITENKIAAELAESLYKEVYSDSIAVHNDLEMMLNVREKRIRHLRNYIRDSSLTDLSESCYDDAFSGFLRNYHFEPKDGILSQLRNSGSLRYFKSTKIQEEIGELSVAIANVRNRNAVEEEFIVTTSRPFLLKYFDYTWFETDVYEPSKKNIKPQILNLSSFNKVDAINLATAFLMMNRGTCYYSYQPYADVNHQLLETLRKEYKVKNE
jgi:hypothetical protein